MASIGDLFFLFRGDDTGLQVDAAKAGDTAGTAAGKRFSVTMGTALKAGIGGAIGGALSAGLGMALKGGAELNAAVTAFAADTGATTEEAAKAQSTIGELFRTNLQGFSEIADAMAKVHNDLGLTGQAADETSAKFLKFGTATGQDAGGAVAAFDDILDAWNLTAADAGPIMDKLIVSHQRFGGSIAESEASLKALAPAMTAANLTVDDGIAMLNLFNAAGIDASKAPQALTKALGKVKSPAELKALIADIAATTDPFERAKKAIDLFGAKAGPQLATALSKGDLAQFTIGMDEAAGATDKAAATIEGGFGNQAQLILKNFGGALAEIGTNFGPLILGFSSLLPALTPIITAAGTAAGGLLAAAVPIGMALLPVLLIGALVAAVAFLIANPEIVGKIAEFVGSILGAIGDFLGTLGEVFATAFAAAVAAVGGAVGQIVAFIGGIPGKVAGFFVSLVRQWIGLQVRVASIVLGLVGQVVGFVLSIPGQIVGLIGAVAGQFATLGGQVVGIVTGFIGQVVGFYLSLPGRVAGLVGTIAGFFVDLGGRILSTVGTLVGQIVGFFLAIPGKVIGIGAEIVGGIIRGMASLPGQLLDTVVAAFSSIKIDIGPFHISSAGVTIDLPKIELPSFAVGSPFIPRDMTALVHAGEMIIPAAESAAIRAGRSVLAAPAAQGSGPSGRPLTVNVYNPAPEPASTSTKRELQKLAAFGVLA
ncbi:MAG: phage tail tape measure protein [Candidatus Limnocylindrales bacterium]